MKLTHFSNEFHLEKFPPPYPVHLRDSEIYFQQTGVKRVAQVLFEVWEEGWGNTRLQDENKEKPSLPTSYGLPSHTTAFGTSLPTRLEPC
jgi:hypothetical protein